MKKNKFSAVRTGRFDSKGEARRAGQLTLREATGLISNLSFQPKVYLTAAKLLYKPDFRYTLSTGEIIHEDFKGMETPVFKLKARLWKHYGPTPLYLTRGTRGKVYKIITPES